MDKDSYWFRHDSNARNDPKMSRLLMLGGQAAKGSFWDVVEILRESDGYKIPLEELPAIEYACRFPGDAIDQMVESRLLKRSDTHVWSESLMRRMKRLDEIRGKRREAGSKGGRARAANAEQGDGNSQAPAKHLSDNDEAIDKQGDGKSKRSEKSRSEKSGSEKEGSAPAPADREYKYTGDKETFTQQVVAIVMESFENWPQSEVEASVLKFHVTKAGLTLDDWKDIAQAAWKGIAPKTPARAYHQKLSWQMDFHLRQRKSKVDGESRETPQQRERREQLEGAARRVREAEEEERENGNEALRTKGRTTFHRGVSKDEDDGRASQPVDKPPGRDK